MLWENVALAIVRYYVKTYWLFLLIVEPKLDVLGTNIVMTKCAKIIKVALLSNVQMELHVRL